MADAYGLGQGINSSEKPKSFMFKGKFFISPFLGKTIMFLNHIEYVNAGWAQNSKSGWRVSAVKIASKPKLLQSC